MAIIKTSWEKVKEDKDKDDYGSITPSGFKLKEYSKNVVPGKYLYHRCHLIAWKLGGRDVDERNLMTGTRDFNVKGMKQFEDKVYKYDYDYANKLIADLKFEQLEMYTMNLIMGIE